ncbi:alpha/beta hydrolase [Pseudonocardia sp. RS010]|uniref:alpha/beta hydrolase n=1 Tax=Pseudonocardia sp. RS010 TaxID=3385979 RepID=UPI0039A1E25B
MGTHRIRCYPVLQGPPGRNDSSATLDRRRTPRPPRRGPGPCSPLRATEQTGSGPLPCIFWIHPGGTWSAHRRWTSRRATDWRKHCRVSSSHPRIPENPYPAAIDDCYAALAWTFRHSEQLNIDPAHVIVAGASTGGGLVAASSLLLGIDRSSQ